MALDRAHKRLFIPAYGNGGYRAFQLDERGLPKDRSAMYVIGRESLYGRRSNPVPSEYELDFPGAITVFDSSTQRLFGIDRFNNRILVFRAAPDEVEKFPAARVVIGQKDIASTERGVAPNRMGFVAAGALDEKGQRLFVADPPNHRVLVFDVHPDRLDSDPAATTVIGQLDFRSRAPGSGPDRLSGPSSVACDPVFQRLFVSDVGNHRVLVFDVDPSHLQNGPRAVAVMGQPDFHSRKPRESLDELAPESLAYDWVHHRLFIAEDLQHRVMVYDAHPDRIGGVAKAIAVIGQPDAFSTHPAVSQNRIAMPRLAVEPETQKLYISEGFPAGNRISIFDIAPEKIATGMFAEDVVGHETPSGGPDFENRMAQGRLDGTSLAAPRALVLDPVDHRLFVADEYNHRVVVWQLDRLNRVLNRSAEWVLGQPDLRTSFMGPPTSSNVTVPLAVAYDRVTKRLFAGDGYHNRVLVYEAAPETLGRVKEASRVLGQRDFTTVFRGAGPSGLNFGVRMGRGIASNFIPMGLAVDEARQRLFVSDGENNRVLVYDVARERLENGAEARAVLGQPDFDSTSAGAGARGLHDPGHLAYDSENERLFVVDSKNRRVMVFDVAPERMTNGASAVSVLGAVDFEAEPGPGADDASFLAPNGVALDAAHQLLYVTDSVVPADRVLVFEVAPGKLESGAPAVAILGASERDLSSRRFFGGAHGYPGQFTLRDARGLDVDPVNGRLFVTGSFESRVVVFHFPRARWAYDVPPSGLQTFHTPDAVDLGERDEDLAVRAAWIEAESGLTEASALVNVTGTFVDERTERHSRMLQSEAALALSPLITRTAYFIDGAPGRRHEIHVFQPADVETAVELSLHDRWGEELASWRHSVPPRGRISLALEDLKGELSEGSTLFVRGTSPVSVNALRVTTNGRGEKLLSPVPSASPGDRAIEPVVPYLVNGGGQQSELVLVNDTDETLRGVIRFHDRFGERASLGPLGMDSELMPYAVPARASRRFRTNGMGPRAVTGYALVSPESGDAPSASALVRRRSGDVWTSESLVSATTGNHFAFAVHTEPTLIRHGEIRTELVVVNPGPAAARLRLSLDTGLRPPGFGQARRPAFALGFGGFAGASRGGESPAKAAGALVERKVLAMQQLVLDAGELFGTGGTSGVLALESDASVSVTARQRTTNLRGEIVEVELPPLAPGAAFPYVPNGKGFSTEIRLANRANAPARGVIEIRLASGELAREAILR